MHNPFTSGRGLVARFAQYAGFRPKAAKKSKKAADDDEDKKKDDDADAASDSPEHGDTGDDPSDDHMAEGDDDDERAEDDGDDEKMSDDPEDDGDEDDDRPKKKTKKKARRANRDDNDQDETKAEGDDDDKKEARRARVHRARVHAFKEGRRAERARWTKILSSTHAAANLDTALRLAANTSLPSVGVIAELRKVSASVASDARRGGNPRIGTDTRGDSHMPPDQQANAAIQAGWAKAFAPTIEAGRSARAVN